MIRLSLLLGFILLFWGCEPEIQLSDAYGNIEATSTLVSAETTGKLVFLKVEEGQKIKEGELIALIDTTEWHLQSALIKANLGTLPQKLQTAIAEVDVLERRKSNMIRERNRVQRLLEKQAATPKQLDDLNGEIEVLSSQIQAVRSQTQTVNQGILSEKAPLLANLDLIKEQIRKSYIYNPIEGRVLSKLAEPYEFVSKGSPLYRIASLDTLSIRVYTDQVQIQSIEIGQQVEVLIDQGIENYESLVGTVSWISDQAEFTPKTIQTKKERVNLVYALKIRVPNPNGLLKIGMPAEVNFKRSNSIPENEK